MVCFCLAHVVGAAAQLLPLPEAWVIMSVGQIHRRTVGVTTSSGSL
jgi:hypothetical protein